ncbi:MAG: hypothetical protein M0Z80_12010 [Treponema sp.]|nr:hypothetical protein [Treponema sp.]
MSTEAPNVSAVSLPVSWTNGRGLSARAFETSIREKRRISLARFPAKRASILAYYAALSAYMRAKLILGGIHGR